MARVDADVGTDRPAWRRAGLTDTAAGKAIRAARARLVAISAMVLVARDVDTCAPAVGQRTAVRYARAGLACLACGARISARATVTRITGERYATAGTVDLAGGAVADPAVTAGARPARRTTSTAVALVRLQVHTCAVAIGQSFGTLTGTLARGAHLVRLAGILATAAVRWIAGRLYTEVAAFELPDRAANLPASESAGGAASAKPARRVAATKRPSSFAHIVTGGSLQGRPTTCGRDRNTHDEQTQLDI